jgi:aminocarboxymuconate-semialdehyde decarboxylase
MIIDAFTHIYPKGYVDFMARVGLGAEIRDFAGLRDPKAKIEAMDRHGIDMQAFTLSTPALNLFGPDEAKSCREAARIANDGIAEVVASRPDRFIGVATLPMTDMEAALSELERVNRLGLRGVQIFSHVGGRPLDGPEFFPLYEKISEYDLPILLHPVGGDYNERTRDYQLWLIFGWPFETSIAMARLVYAGVLEKYPRLKIITHHLGAFIPSLSRRILSVSRRMEKSPQWKLPQPALSYFKRFYGDTAVHGHKATLNDGYDFFGPDRIVFGTDYPFAPLDEVMPPVMEWEIPSREKQKILGENAKALFHV